MLWTFAFSNYEFFFVRSNNLSLKYQRLTASSYKDMEITNLSFWQKHFLYVILFLHLYSLIFLPTMHNGSIENFQFASILSFTFTDQLDIKIYFWFNIFQSCPDYNLTWGQNFSLLNLRINYWSPSLTDSNTLIHFWSLIDGSSINHRILECPHWILRSNSKSHIKIDENHLKIKIIEKVLSEVLWSWDKALMMIRPTDQFNSFSISFGSKYAGITAWSSIDSQI